MSVYLKLSQGDIPCRNQVEMMTKIKSEFLNQHIAIIEIKPSGIHFPHYVSVDDNGGLSYTYTDKCFDGSALNYGDT